MVVLFNLKKVSTFLLCSYGKIDTVKKNSERGSSDVVGCGNLDWNFTAVDYLIV